MCLMNDRSWTLTHSPPESFGSRFCLWSPPTVGRVSTSTSITGDLTLGHIFNAAGLDLSQVVVLRHTYTSDGLATPADVTPSNVLEYVRRQAINNKLSKTPPFLWLNFMTDGGRRSRRPPSVMKFSHRNGGVLPSLLLMACRRTYSRTLLGVTSAGVARPSEV